MEKHIIEYADKYSKDVWNKLMKDFEEIPNFKIGCNDVSDLVLNAILDALNGMKEFKNTNYNKNICITTDVGCKPSYEPINASAKITRMFN